MKGDVIIRKQKISVKVSDELVALECRQFFNEFASNELPKLYERIFYQNIESDTYVNIKSLRINLGVISKSELKDHFIKMAEEGIINELKKQFEQNTDDDERAVPNTGASTHRTNQDPPVQYLTKKQQNITALLYFLEHGLYPWWYKKEERKSPVEFLNNLNNDEQSEFLFRFFTRCREVTTPEIEAFVKRFLDYVSNSTCESYIKQIAGLYADNLLKKNVRTILSQKGQFTSLFNISLKAFYEQVFSFVLTSGDKANFLKLFVNRLYEVYPLAANQSTTADFNLRSIKYPFLIIPDAGQLEAERSKKQEKQEKQAISQPAQQEIYVDNAGLVLLHPFLPAYFNGLGLTNEQDQFNSLEDQSRAAVLLYYLQCNNGEYKEWEMPLNKILCGLGVNDVIVNGIELTEKEITESLLLLTTVANHWSALKGASTVSMQNTFFLREGKVTFKQDAWLIQVERTAVDVLLDRLPWGFGTIKLPWLKHLIHTEW